MHHSWWRQMETFSALLALCEGNSPVNSPHKGQWRGALMFSKICAWMNGWVNNGKTGDLRRHRAHYDVTVMWPFVRGRHQRDSRQGPVVQKLFPCHGVIIFWHYNFPICISNKNVNMLSGWTHREQILIKCPLCHNQNVFYFTLYAMTFFWGNIKHMCIWAFIY